MLKALTVIVWDNHFESHLVELRAQVSWDCGVLLDLEGGGRQDFLGA